MRSPFAELNLMKFQTEEIKRCLGSQQRIRLVRKPRRMTKFPIRLPFLYQSNLP